MANYDTPLALYVGEATNAIAQYTITLSPERITFTRFVRKVRGGGRKTSRGAQAPEPQTKVASGVIGV